MCRAELSPAQRAATIQRRKEIWDALHPEQVVSVNVKTAGATICPTGRKVESIRNSGTIRPTIPARGRGRPEEFATDTAKVADAKAGPQALEANPFEISHPAHRVEEH